MVTRWCIVRNGLILNTILWDGESDWTPPKGCEVVPEGTPGFSYPEPEEA